MGIFFSMGSDSIGFQLENVIEIDAIQNQSSLTPLKGAAS